MPRNATPTNTSTATSRGASTATACPTVARNCTPRWRLSWPSWLLFPDASSVTSSTASSPTPPLPNPSPPPLDLSFFLAGLIPAWQGHEVVGRHLLPRDEPVEGREAEVRPSCRDHALA